MRTGTFAGRLPLGNLVLILLGIPGLCIPAWANGDACGARGGQVEALQPADFDAHASFQQARMLARDGNYDAAIQEYRQLAALHPDDVDYLFGEAQVRFWVADNECALLLASRARRLAPDYEDVWKLEYRVLQALHDADSGARHGEDRVESFRRAANARFPGAAWLSAAPAGSGPRWRWETGLNHESLDNGAADWQDAYAYIDRRSPDDDLVSLTVSEHRRFALVDNEVAIGGALKAARSWLFEGAFRLSPDADFLAEVVVDAGAKKQLGNGWLAGIDLRLRRYPDDTVNTWGVNAERYFGSFRAAYRIGSTRLASSSSLMHSGVLDYYADSGSRYGLSVAAGDEVEVISPGQLLEMDISAVALSGSHPLGDRLNILWRVGTHRQGSIYRRNSVGLSIAGDF